MNRLFEAIANDEVISERWAELGITRRKVFQYLGLFYFLLIFYSIRLTSYLKFFDAANSAGLGLGDLLKPLVGSSLVSALPFVALAYSDKTWRSSDAASVISAAWTVVYICLSLQYHELCPMGPLMALVPFTLSALLGHTVGTLCQRVRHGDMKST